MPRSASLTNEALYAWTAVQLERQPSLSVRSLLEALREEGGAVATARMTAARAAVRDEMSELPSADSARASLTLDELPAELVRELQVARSTHDGAIQAVVDGIVEAAHRTVADARRAYEDAIAEARSEALQWAQDVDLAHATAAAAESAAAALKVEVEHLRAAVEHARNEAQTHRTEAEQVREEIVRVLRRELDLVRTERASSQARGKRATPAAVKNDRG